MHYASVIPLAPKSSPVAFSCSSKLQLESLLDNARKLSKGEDFVLLLNQNQDSLLGRVLPSYINAYVRYKEDTLRSETLQIEILLFFAGTFKISEAIEECGATDSAKFIMVASSRVLAKRYARVNKVELVKEHKLEISKDFIPAIE